MSSLGEEYPKEQERLRGLIEQYKEIGPAGAFGLMAIRSVLRRADIAAASQDTIEMIRCYNEMKGCQ